MPARSSHLPARPADVLVVKPSSFGDIIHTLPAVHALKLGWPDSRLHWVANEEWTPLLEGNPDLHAVIPFPRKNLRGLSAVPGFIHWCRSGRATTPEGGFGLAVDFQGLLRSALIAKGCGGRRILGLSDAREGAGWFYHQTAETKHHLHAVDRYLSLADLAGGDTRTPSFPLPPGQPIDGLDTEMLKDAVLFHPFARGEGKSLPLPMIADTIRAMAPRPVMLIGVGGPGEGAVWPENAMSLLNQTDLPQLIWLLRKGAAMISVDSGPMHLAAALDLPLLSLHTWSDPRKVGPWRKNAWVWKGEHLCQVKDLPSEPPAWCEAAEAGWSGELPQAVAGWLAGNHKKTPLP